MGLPSSTGSAALTRAMGLLLVIGIAVGTASPSEALGPIENRIATTSVLLNDFFNNVTPGSSRLITDAGIGGDDATPPLFNRGTTDVLILARTLPTLTSGVTFSVQAPQLTAAGRANIETFLNQGGVVVTEFSSNTLWFTSANISFFGFTGFGVQALPNFAFPSSVVSISGSDLTGFDCPVDLHAIVDANHPIVAGIASPFSDNLCTFPSPGAGDLHFNLSGDLAANGISVITKDSDETFDAAPTDIETIAVAKRGAGLAVMMLSDWQDINSTNPAAIDADIGRLWVNVANLVVTPVNDTPVATPQSVTTFRGTLVTITLSGTDVETAAANLIYTVVSGPTNGTLTGTGQVRTYTPSPSFIGTDSFTFTVTDRGDPDGCAPVSSTCAGPLTSAAATVTITVLPASDLVGLITGPAVACPDQVIGGAITLTVRNLGPDPVGQFFVGVYLSADATITTSDSLLVGGRESVVSLGGNAIASVPLFSGASVPASTPIGPRFLGLLVDELNAVVETNEGNNGTAIPITIVSCATLTLGELSPASAGQGALNRSVSLAGVNFKAGATVSFGAGITVTSVTVNSSTQITVTLNVDPAAAIGPRNVTVTNLCDPASPPGCVGPSSTLAGAFTVTPAPTITTVTTDRNNFASPPLPLDNTLSRNVNGQSFTITGTGFQSGLTVDFGPKITASFGLPAFAAGTIIAGTADVAADATLGLRTLTVENADGGRAMTTINVADPLPGQLSLAGLGAPPSSTSSGTATPPSITSLIPNAGLLGSSVSISGSNFAATTAGNSVTFAGPGNTRLLATVNTASSTSLTVTVPAQAVDGPVTVSVNGLLSNQDKIFTVTNPRLSAVIPGSGTQNTSVTLDLTGTKFASGITVAFSPATGIIGAVTFIDATHIQVPVTIAADAPTGLRGVTVTNPATASSPAASSTLPGAFEVKQRVAAFLELSLPAFANNIANYEPSVDAVSVTLDGTGLCTAKAITPHLVTLQAQFKFDPTLVTGTPTAPTTATFDITSVDKIPGTSTNENCEVIPQGALPTTQLPIDDFSITDTLATSGTVNSRQVANVTDIGGGTYQVKLWSWDWGGSVTITATGTATVNGVAQQVTGSLTLPVDADKDKLPDSYETNAALNANAAGANVLDRLNKDQNGNGTPDGDDRFAQDGLSNFEKYRGVYLTGPAKGSTGAMTGHVRLGAGKRHLFARGRGFGNDPAITAGFCGIDPSTGAPVADATLSATNPCPPFEVGGAIAAIGIEVHDVTGSFTASTQLPRQSLADPTKATLDMATVTYDGVGCGSAAGCSTSKIGVRQWEFSTLGFSAFGTATAYAANTKVFKKAVDAYFGDKPYEHRTNDPARVVLGSDGRPMLAPITLVGDSSSRGADNGIVDAKEATVAGQLAGDTYIAGSVNLQLSVMDVTNDGCVELPFVADPTTLPARCDPAAASANPGPQATKRQVARSLTTHELFHGIGVNFHDSNVNSIMYQYTINWTRDGFISPEAAALAQVHNHGLQ